MKVNFVEQAVLNPPQGMEGWRNFRIEYGGHARDCIVEGLIWLPPGADRDEVEAYFKALCRGEPLLYATGLPMQAEEEELRKKATDGE